VVEIITPDRPGLLATIAAVFLEHGLILLGARITTLGERVEDLFYVIREDGTPFARSAFGETLERAVIAALDSAADQTDNLKEAS
jgi:[protein-PII] uridylyltransferase